jgi:hypothetical protein
VEAKKSKSNKWDWMKDLMAIIRNISGLIKLLSSRPNTAPIGNLAVLQVVQKIAEWTDLGSAFQAKLFMGKPISKKQLIEVPISKKDTVDNVTQQWGALRLVADI